ncbi:MAG: DHH family phosphoesterase [Ignavibacteriales bacterium]|nr:DHH family phosphoesterase [Ignavibacteriales bacterium]
MTIYDELLSLLIQHDNYIITTHVNPDADAIGSVLVMHRILKHIEKKSRIINYSATPHYLEFLDTGNEIEKYRAAIHDEAIINAGAIITLDFNRPGRLSKMSAAFDKSTAVKICIDHHQDPSDVYNYVFDDTGWCATGHFLFNFIKQTRVVPLEYQYAEPLYAAIMTDTGSFRFERVTPEIHRIAAELLEAGVVPNYVHGKIYDQNSIGKLHLLGQAMETMQLLGENDGLGVIVIRQNQFIESGTKEDDTEGFINMMMSISSVKIGMKFLELKEGFKVSLRSKGSIPVHLLAGMYGGGGHRNASGIRVANNTLDEKYDEMIQTALTFLKEHENESEI